MYVRGRSKVWVVLASRRKDASHWSPGGYDLRQLHCDNVAACRHRDHTVFERGKDLLIPQGEYFSITSRRQFDDTMDN